MKANGLRNTMRCWRKLFLFFLRAENCADTWEYPQGCVWSAVGIRGSYKGFSCHLDKDGIMNLVFQHEYGMKWSRILSAVYTRFIQRTLNQPAYPLKLAQTWFAIRLSERIENQIGIWWLQGLQNATIIIMRSRAALISLRNDNHQLLSLILCTRVTTPELKM